MEKEWGIEIQRQFSKLHRIIFPVIMLFFLIEKFIFDMDIAVAPILFFLVFMVVETIVISMKKCREPAILVLRYAEGAFSCFFMFATTGQFRYSFFLILMILFTIEYFLCFDFMDSYFRTLCILTVIIPVIAFVLMNNILLKSIGDTLLMDLFICFVYIMVVAFAGEIIAKSIYNFEKKLFAQSRLVESVNETNEELRINQEKVKRANELLGVQKIKLQTANKQIENANAQMQIQNQIMKYISSSLEIGKLMNLITESIEKEIGVDVCAIVLYPGTVQNKKVIYKIKTHLNQSFEDHLSSEIEAMCFENYIDNNFTYYDNHVDEKRYDFLSSRLMGSIMIMPLLQDGERIGVFFVGYPKYDFFMDNKQFFENIVSQFLIAIANANMYMKMETMAIKDGLTNIYNRRHLTKMFNEAMNEAILAKQSLSVALFDIDKFKNINDRYGHLFGDVVIKTVAALADEYAQEAGGFAGRYGGEEFVIVFPNKSLQEAYETVKKVHGEVKATVLNHNDILVHITVSAGVTSYPETCSNPGELLNRADWAMYYSKEHGRDQITVDSDEVRREVMIK